MIISKLFFWGKWQSIVETEFMQSGKMSNQFSKPLNSVCFLHKTK